VEVGDSAVYGQKFLHRQNRVKIAVFGDMTPCYLLIITGVSEENSASIFKVHKVPDIKD
jgi:hypothetical protein